jgi:4-aminobutyrate aminotransferase/diaminobutyrate-pyruvate transaminase/4-aminobutyrate aminotransferase/(S)-3-amino-2-methylpropionate transaminase
VETKYRRIVTDLPVPESLPVLEKLRQFEPRSMSGQPLVVWDRAEGVQVFDRWGNRWLDWSSGVVVANAGHGHPDISRAMTERIQHGLVHNYCFPSEIRAELACQLARVAPPGLRKVFLLTTGSEACECAIKLARTHGRRLYEGKITIVSFHNSFHGRTLGSQMAGGVPALKSWIVNLDRNLVQVPFPDGFRCADTRFERFLEALEDLGVSPAHVAGVMTETYQGGNASFAPPEYMQQLRRWCDEQRALLICDEVQAGFGRTGTYWGFEHYGIVPDLICCGKGITSGMPLSAVIGRPEVLDLYPPGSMTSTHTGNPVCAAAALANLAVIEKQGLVEHSRRMGEILQPLLRQLGERHPRHIGAVHGKGLVGSLHMVRPGSRDPNPELASSIVRRCVEKGLMLFAPVGFGGASVKISPPLVIEEDALQEGAAVLGQATEEAVAATTS